MKISLREISIGGLVIEGIFWLGQRIKGHPVQCPCSECVIINVSIPITAVIALADDEKRRK